MTTSILKRLVRAMCVLLVVSLATFSLMFGNATGIARSVLGLNASPEQVQAEVVRLGLDRPLLTQFYDWISSAITGDLGASYLTGQAVTDALSSRVPVTFSLIVITMLLTVIISVLLGVLAAVYGGWLDKFLQFVSALGMAVPPFVTAIGLVFAFAIVIPYYPATGYIRLTESPQGWAWSLVLPVAALLAGTIANAAAQFRGAVVDTLSQDYVRTLRARGIPERVVILRHVLRNAAGPGLISLGLIMLGLIAGTIFIEDVFALPGIGRLANMSAQSGDVPMVMGTVIVVAVLVLVVNFLTDLLATALNPKARKR